MEDINKQPTYIRISPESVRFDESFNPRWKPISDKAIRDRADSMVANGQSQPVLLRKNADGEYWLVFGLTRLKGGLLVNKENLDGSGGEFKITATLRELTDEQAYLQAIVENMDRNEVTVIDTAHNGEFLRSTFKYTDSQICDVYRVKKSERKKWLKDMARLRSLPVERQDEINSGILNASVGYILAEIADPAEQEAVLRAAGISNEMPPVAGDEPNTTAPPADAAPDVTEGPKKRGRKPAAKKAPKPKKVTKRAVVKAAKDRGHLKGKKASRLVAEMREFWKPLADQKKITPIVRLAKAELAFYDGGSVDEYYAGIVDILKK